MQTRVVKQQVPSALLECEPAPAVPANPGDQDLAGFIANLWFAHEDCESKLASVKELVDAPKEEGK